MCVRMRNRRIALRKGSSERMARAASTGRREKGCKSEDGGGVEGRGKT